MRRNLLLLGLLAGFAAVATLPLSLATPHLALPGITADEAAGTLWSGTLRATRMGGQALGDIGVALRPLPLLLGQRQVDLSGASWSARIAQGRRTGVLSSDGLLPPTLLAPLGGASLGVSLRQARLLFEDGRCIDAAGSVVAVLQWQDAQLPELQLEGPVECAGGEGRVSLTNADRGPFPVQLLATISGDGSYRLHASAQPVDALARTALVMAGFHDSPTGLGQSLEGNLLK